MRKAIPLRTIFLMALILLLNACSKVPFFSAQKYSTVNMTRAANDLELPSSLWDLVQKVYQPMAMEAVPEGEGKSAAGFEIPTSYAPITVYLVEKNPGVLGGHNHELVFGNGGGEIDLRDFVSDVQGSYYLGVKFNEDVGESPLHVFFLSNSIPRKLDDKLSGSGCSRYYDISGFFKSSMSGRGFLLNTTEQMDVSALAGTFFFAVSNGRKLHVSELTIKDSRYRALQCRRE